MSKLHWRNTKPRQSPAILDLCLRKTGTGRSRDYCDVIILEKLSFQNVSLPHENEKLAFISSSGLKSSFKKFRFRFGLVWTEGIRIKCVFKFLWRSVDSQGLSHAEIRRDKRCRNVHTSEDCHEIVLSLSFYSAY